MIYENYHVSRHLGRKLEKNEKNGNREGLEIKTVRKGG